MTLGPYTAGDRPVTPIELDFYPLENAEAYASASITIRDEDEAVTAVLTNVPLVDQKVTFSLPDGAIPDAGLYSLTPVLNAGDDFSVTLQRVKFVVTEEDGWYSVSSAREVWSQAPEDVELHELLEVARGQVLEFAPALEEDQRVPVSYRRAQLNQARDLLNANQANPSSGDSGEGSFALTIFPMSWHTKNLLRPAKGSFNVG